MMKLRRKMLRRKTDAKTVKHTLWEPAQSKCTLSQEAFCAEIYREMPDATGTTSIQHRALTITVRTHSVWPHCLGIKTGCF